MQSYCTTFRIEGRSRVASRDLSVRLGPTPGFFNRSSQPALRLPEHARCWWLRLRSYDGSLSLHSLVWVWTQRRALADDCRCIGIRGGEWSNQTYCGDDLNLRTVASGIRVAGMIFVLLKQMILVAFLCISVAGSTLLMCKWQVSYINKRKTFYLFRWYFRSFLFGEWVHIFTHLVQNENQNAVFDNDLMYGCICIVHKSIAILMYDVI